MEPWCQKMEMLNIYGSVWHKIFHVIAIYTLFSSVLSPTARSLVKKKTARHRRSGLPHSLAPRIGLQSTTTTSNFRQSTPHQSSTVIIAVATHYYSTQETNTTKKWSSFRGTIPPNLGLRTENENSLARTVKIVHFMVFLYGFTGRYTCPRWRRQRRSPSPPPPLSWPVPWREHRA